MLAPFGRGCEQPGVPRDEGRPISGQVRLLRQGVQAQQPRVAAAVDPLVEERGRLGNAPGQLRVAFVGCQDRAAIARPGGDPYIPHPVAVASIIAQLHLDHEAVMAALLHDVIEDTPYTEEQLKEEFGASVAEIVDGVSKLDKLKFRTRQEAQVENFRKMILAMTRDIRVVLIELADRTHNMRTLGSLRPDKRRRIAKETLEIYCPLAHRLGIEHIKNELEDLSFQAMHPHRYEVLKKLIDVARSNRQDLIERISQEIKVRLENVIKEGQRIGLKAQIFL